MFISIHRKGWKNSEFYQYSYPCTVVMLSLAADILGVDLESGHSSNVWDSNSQTLQERFEYPLV